MEIRLKLKSLRNESELAQSRRDETLNSSPLIVLKEACRKQIEVSEKYRVSVLKKVAAFAKLTDNYLLSAAQNMEEMIVPCGAILIRQDDIGDSFYIIEQGQVSVTRKVNVNDPNEPSTQLAVLGSNTYFGEIALLTQEPRTATITVISPTAKILMMTKSKFDMIMEQCNTQLFNDKKEIGREVMNKVPLFQSLSISKRKAVLDSMRPMNFLPNTYICRQGTSGNTFYIIADGQCRVTVNAGHRSEREVTTLGPGDFFGEVALIEPSNKRTANVISLSNVTCMSLNRTDFTQLLSNVRSTLIENSAVRTLVLKKVKKETKSTKSHNEKRRVTIFDDNNQKSYVLITNFLRKLIKSMVDSLYISIYARFYRDLILKPESLDLYGDIGRSILVMCSTRESAVSAIMDHAHSISKIDPTERSVAENSFIFGLMVQKNKLKDKICKDWPLYQYRLLCRHIRIISVKPLTKFVEVGSSGTSAYVILRGCVRVFSSQTTEGNLRMTRYEEDLYPGDCCCESALDGAKTRFLTILTITACDMAVIEYSQFYIASDKNEQRESIDNKIQFLTRTSIFRHWDAASLYRIANAMVREEIPKNTIITTKGEISKKLCLLMEGRIDIVAGLNSHQLQHIVTTVNQYECFNESGILTHMASSLQVSNNGGMTSNYNNHNGHNNHNHYVETCYAVSGSHVVILSLPENNYHVLEQNIIEKLSVAFREKNVWRLNRMINLRTESKNIKKWKKQLKLFNDDQNTNSNFTFDSNSSSSFPSSSPSQMIKSSQSQSQFQSPTHLQQLSQIQQPQQLQLFQPPQIQSQSHLTTFSNLEDIPPIVLDAGIDPVLALSTCRNSREVRSLQTNLKEINRPYTSRTKTAKKDTSSITSESIPLLKKNVVYTPGKFIQRSHSLPLSFSPTALQDNSDDFSFDSSNSLPSIHPKTPPSLSSSEVGLSSNLSTSPHLRLSIRKLIGSIKIPSLNSTQQQSESQQTLPNKNSQSETLDIEDDNN